MEVKKIPREKWLVFQVICVALLTSNLSCGQSSVSKTEVQKKCSGMVVTAHPEATKIGTEILNRGGNAVDAAVAIQFALAVSAPFAGNIGGGGFFVFRDSAGETATLDFREKAPETSTKNMYLNEKGDVISEKSTAGRLASGVPGSVDGMFTAHEKFGKLSWKELVEPSVSLAKNGFPVTKQQADELNAEQKNFRTHNPDYKACPLLKTSPWKEGDTLQQIDLSNTLSRIRDQGRDGFYGGETSKLIAEEMRNGGGLITENDLENYHSIWREPLVGNYKNYKIISVGPPSSGGILLVQMLQMVSKFPLKKWGIESEKTIHVMVEAMRRAFADRSEHLGDPDFWKVPVKQLLDTNYLSERMKNFNADLATPSSEIQAGKFSGKQESEETTHFSVVDANGNAVSVTTTLNSWYGSKVMVRGAGFLLNNEMDDFSTKPGAPNLYGLIGAEANAIAGGKRMVSSMTPTIIEKDNKLYLIIGTPGGSTIPNSVFQVFLYLEEFNITLQDAITKLRFHHQWLPDKILIEPGAFSSELKSKLEKMGHVVENRGAIGRVDAIRIREDGRIEGGADSRGDDCVGCAE